MMRATPAVYTSPLQYEKSFANSHEAILLRRVLQDEETREPFQRYLCIKASPGTHPREDIQFWLEVQRYKVEPPQIMHIYNYIYIFDCFQEVGIYDSALSFCLVYFITVSLTLSSTKPVLKLIVTHQQ